MSEAESRGGGPAPSPACRCCSTGRRGQDPAGQPARGSPSWGTGSSSSRSARCWRPPPPCARSCEEIAASGTPAAAAGGPARRSASSWTSSACRRCARRNSVTPLSRTPGPRPATGRSAGCSGRPAAAPRADTLAVRVAMRHVTARRTDRVAGRARRARGARRCRPRRSAGAAEDGEVLEEVDALLRALLLVLDLPEPVAQRRWWAPAWPRSPGPTAAAHMPSASSE